MPVGYAMLHPDDRLFYYTCLGFFLPGAFGLNWSAMFAGAFVGLLAGAYQNG